MSPSAALVAASALVILFLGLTHLWFTFVGAKLHPRSVAVREAMQSNHLNLTRQTTIWRAWIGFNASHSLGAILFGLVFGYLALAESRFLLASPFLLAVGLLVLSAYVVIGRRYWFSVPFRGIVVSAVLYVLALAMAAAGA